jgi:tetratricopeptide (TPR) repeat protein
VQLPLLPLDDKYQIIHSLGEGGFGRVWLAEDVLIEGRHVAIKQLRNESLGDTEMLIEEMHHLSSLDHPHVVKFLHHFQDDENLYLVMEYCAGGSLDASARGRALAPAKVFAWGKTLTDTLAEVHRHGIVHHDIKPQNLLLTDDGRLKIADFGVANRNWGTRAYMAPELSLGEATSDDVRIDIYALGVTLLELLLGRNPLRGIPDNELLRAKILHEFIPTTLDRWIQEILLKATHPTPEQRFQSMVDFAQAIDSHHVPYIIDRDRLKAHGLAEKASNMIARRKWVTAKSYIDHALLLAPDCISALVIGGRLELLMRRTAYAKTYFSEAVRISPRVNLQKELGWIALEEGNHAQAISMLTDHLQREAADYEACNLLMQCFYETGRYELGMRLTDAVIAQKVANDCFENNQFLCRLLLEGCSPSFLADYEKDKLTNPFMRMNLDIATESPASWTQDDGPPLKSKLLFQEYRFGTIEKRRKPHTLVFDCGDGYSYTFQTPLVTLGRYDSNDIPFGQNGISRRHAVIANFPGDVWIYDMGSVTGVRVDGTRVSGKAFLDGVHGLKIGARSIKVATDEGLLV